MSLSKMLLLPPETYSKLKENIEDETNLSYLDRKMNKILKNRTLSSDKKWYMYRQMLIKYSIIKRKISEKNKIMEPTKSYKREHKSSPTYEYKEHFEDDESDEDEHEEFVHENELEFDDVPQRLSMSLPAKHFYNISGINKNGDEDDKQVDVPQFQSSPKNLGEGGYRERSGNNDMSVDSDDDVDGAVGEDALETYSTPQSRPSPFLIKPSRIPTTPRVKSLKRLLDNSHSAPSPHEKKRLRNEERRLHVLRPRDEKGQAIHWKKL